MQIEIHPKKIEVDESLRTHIERRLGHTIGRFDEFIRRVTVHLANGNGACGAPSKLCRICVSLKSSGDIEIADSDVDICAATDRATHRLGLAVFGELWRRRESRRSCPDSKE